jgi:hypothetical protein
MYAVQKMASEEMIHLDMACALLSAEVSAFLSHGNSRDLVSSIG